MNEYLVRAGLVLAGLLLAMTAQAQTVFTLQGKLENSGQFVNGNYDFVIDAYDASSGGALLGSFSDSNVPVDQGEFTLHVDLGGIFTGSSVWLEIQAGPAGGALTPLQGRTQVRATPMSQLALQVADGAVGAAQVDSAEVQLRVNGFCAPGTAMVGVDASGGVQCSPNNAGEVANVTTLSMPGGGGEYVNLHTAIADAASWCSSTGDNCTLKVAPGLYQLDDATLNIPSTFPNDLVIQGAGKESTLFVASGGTATTLITAGVETSFHDLYLRWEAPASAQYMVDATSAVNFYDCKVRMALDSAVETTTTAMGLYRLNSSFVTEIFDSEIDLSPGLNTDAIDITAFSVIGILSIRNSTVSINSAGTATAISMTGFRLPPSSSGGLFATVNSLFLADSELDFGHTNGVLVDIGAGSFLSLRGGRLQSSAVGVQLQETVAEMHHSRIVANGSALRVLGGLDGLDPDNPQDELRLLNMYLVTYQNAPVVELADASGAALPQEVLFINTYMHAVGTGGLMSAGAEFLPTCMATTTKVPGSVDFLTNTCP